MTIEEYDKLIIQSLYNAFGKDKIENIESERIQDHKNLTDFTILKIKRKD